MRTPPFGRAVMACAFVLAACTWWASPASAHSGLIDSTPAEGAVLTAAPRTIELEFNDDISDISPAVILRNGEDDVISREAPRIERTTVSSDVPDGLADGDYSVVWRVVSADGHPIQGVIPFSIDTAEPAGEPGEATASAPQPDDTPAASQATQPTASTASTSGVPWLPLTIAAVVAIAFVGGAMALRRTRRDHTPNQENP